jgi:hypothetical protein
VGAVSGEWHCKQLPNGTSPIVVCERETLQIEIERLRAENERLTEQNHELSTRYVELLDAYQEARREVTL